MCSLSPNQLPNRAGATWTSVIRLGFIRVIRVLDTRKHTEHTQNTHKSRVFTKQQPNRPEGEAKKSAHVEFFPEFVLPLFLILI